MSRTAAPVPEASDQPAIVFDRVSKRYRLYSSPRHRLADLLFRRSPAKEHWALRDVDLRIEQGESIGLVGANGAGKSTLLALVAAATAPTAGEVRVAGRVSALLELGAGFHPDWTGRQNAEFQIRLRGADAASARALTREVEAFADIGEYFDQPLRTCSSGMALRVAFAAATCIEPAILIVDEALAVGDAAFQHKCFRRLAEFRARGVTILLVTHRLDLVPQLCSRALVIAGGRLAFDGGPADALACYFHLVVGSADAPAAGAGAAVERRAGAGGARIEAARAANSPSLAFASGASAILEVGLRFDRDVAEPVFGFALRSVEGVVLYATSTSLLGAKMEAAARGETRAIRVEVPLRLAAGTIFADFSISAVEDGELRVLDVRLSMLQLEIGGGVDFLGVADLQARISERPAR